MIIFSLSTCVYTFLNREFYFRLHYYMFLRTLECEPFGIYELRAVLGSSRRDWGALNLI